MLDGSKLLSIIDFDKIGELDIYSIEYLSKNELEELIKYFPRVNSLIMEYNPLFVIPSQIDTLRLEGDITNQY